MAENRVLYAKHDGVHILRYVGEIRHPSAPAVDRQLHRILDEDPRPAIVIDLNDTVCIDSTHLGILARFAISLKERGAARMAITTGRKDIRELLDCMGFAEIFDIADERRTEQLAGQELDNDEPDRHTMSEAILTAHRALMALNDRNRARFKDVVAALEGKPAPPDNDEK